MICRNPGSGIRGPGTGIRDEKSARTHRCNLSLDIPVEQVRFSTGTASEGGRS
jgi:hypothetical protein